MDDKEKGRVRAGEVYLPKSSDAHALIIKKVNEDGSFIYLNTGMIGQEGLVVLNQGKPADLGLLEHYVLATPERLVGLIAGLDSARRIAQREADFLGLCCMHLKAFCDKSSSGFSSGVSIKEPIFYEKPREEDPLKDQILQFRCEQEDCTFSYHEGYKDSDLKFLSCKHAKGETKDSLEIVCTKSGQPKPCKPFNDFHKSQTES